MTKKKPKRVAKPRPLYSNAAALAKCDTEFYGVRSIMIERFRIGDINARRLSAWLLRAAAWCEEGSVTR